MTNPGAPGYPSISELTIRIERGVRDKAKWAVFEPNGPALWAQIAQTLEQFLQDLFEQGALVGAAPQQAYFVECGMAVDAENEIDGGLVNIIVGFAPLRPAEFVILTIQQIVGQGPAA